MTSLARLLSSIGVSVIAAQSFTDAARGEVTRVNIASRTDVLGGRTFGAAGAYEKIVGTVFFALDPALPANRGIVDLDKAPRDKDGRVVFSADLFALVPKNAARGNGVALFDVPNRGYKTVFGYFDGAAPSLDLTAAAKFGDASLMRDGYSLVCVGWQFDVARRDGLMGLQAPLVLEQGRPMQGRVSTRFVLNRLDTTYRLDALGYGDTTRYVPVDPAHAVDSLTVRDGYLAAPTAIAGDAWGFGRLAGSGVIPDLGAIFLKNGFAPGRVYELRYEATGAVVAGVGFAALRDLASAVKFGIPGSPALPISAPYAVAFGLSQDGRLLREFLYEGFNGDEAGRRAFDGVMAHIAGSSRSNDFNARFARPNGLGFFESSLFPFRDAASRDEVSGKTDGLLSHLAPELQPKIFYTNSSTEYSGGGRAAALTHTTLDGKRDAEVPDNVRIYLFSGTQHVPSDYPAGRNGAQQASNPNDYSWGLRALLPAMERWVRDGTPPPPSSHPRLSDHTLVPIKNLDFPAIPGVQSPLSIPGGYRNDLDGPDGPAIHSLPFLVPQVDGDGNELGGIAFPDVAAPLATYTGWNFRHPAIGQPGEILPLTGSYIPLPLTRAERELTHDPRLSIEERYGSRARYQAIVADRAQELAKQGYLLGDDVGAVVANALARFDDMTRGTPLAASP
jgi:hypothetical protein